MTMNNYQVQKTFLQEFCSFTGSGSLYFSVEAISHRMPLRASFKRGGFGKSEFWARGFLGTRNFPDSGLEFFLRLVWKERR